MSKKIENTQGYYSLAMGKRLVLKSIIAAFCFNELL